MHPNSRMLFMKYARPLFTPGLRVLEISPDGFPSTYESAIEDPAVTWEYLGLGARSPDMVRPKMRHVSEDEYHYPLADGEFDIVISGQVIEHVKKIWLWVPELARVCKVGGYVVTIGPLSWVNHRQPVDCWRIHPDGMHVLYEEAGLQITHVSCESLDGRETDTITVGRK